MGFNVLTIRSGLDTGDDALYPMLTDESSPEIIAMDQYDGRDVTRTVATAVSVQEVTAAGLKTIASLREVKIDVYITGGRLALACEKYDKGGGWVGFGGAGVMVALTANAVSKIRAANRSRGKVLVGHIRYPWLKAVGASSKTGFTSAEAIRLEYTEKLTSGTVRKILQFTLPKNIDATLVAQEIIHRAAKYRLAYYPDLGAAERAKFSSLSQAPPRLQPAAKKFAFEQLPTYYFATAGTAFPNSTRSAGQATAGAQPPAPYPPAGNPQGVPPQPPAPYPPAGVAGPSAVLRFCTACGTRREPEDSFCQQCGVPLEGAGNHAGNSVAS